MTFRHARSLAFLIGLSVWLPAMALEGGQPATPVAEPASQEPESPKAIRPGSIVIEAELAQKRFRTIVTSVESSPDVSRIEGELPGAAERVQALSPDVDLDRLKRSSLQDLDEQGRVWRAERKRFADWATDLERSSGRLGGHLDDLAEVRQIWSLTEAASTDDDLPASTRELISATLEGVEQTAASVRDGRQALLELQNRVSAELNSIDEKLASIAATVGERRQNLLRTDSQPIWRVLPNGDHLDSLLAHLGATRGHRREQFKLFAKANSTVFFWHGLLTLALIIQFVRLRRRIARWSDEERDQHGSLDALNRPISGALVVAALLTPSLYPHAPQNFGTLIGLIVLVPALRVFSALVPRTVHPMIYALVPVWIVARILDSAGESTPLVRLILLAETTLVAGLLFVALRRVVLFRAGTRTRWSNALRATLMLLFALFAVATIVNVIGNFQLASILTFGGVESLFALIVVFSVARVMDTAIWAGLRTPIAGRLPSIRHHRNMIYERLSHLLEVGLALFFIYYVLDVFGFYEATTAAAWAILDATYAFGSFQISLGGVLSFLIVIWASFALSRFVRFILNEDIVPRLRLPRGVPQAFSRLVHYTILLCGFLLAVSSAGVGLDNLVLLTGAFGVGIGFGLQNVVNNFVSGLILLFERPIKVGDVIEVGQLTGEVRQIGMRASSVRTWNGAEVIVPNGHLVSSEVINWTLSDRHRRLEVPVGVKYGTDPEAVLQLLLDVAKNHEKVLADPRPSSIFDGFGDSSLDFTLRAWTADFDDFMRVKSDLTVAICTALAEAEIEVPFPQRDLHLRSVDAAAATDLPARLPNGSIAEPDVG